MGTQAAARRKALARRERGLAVLAEKQHGVLARRQLLEAGLAPRTIRRRVEAGRLHRVHREVYAYGRKRLTRRGRWLAAIFACGEGAVLSHRSAAALWGLMEWQTPEVTAPRGRQRQGIAIHECGLHPVERTSIDLIPVTTVARVLLDLAEVVDSRALKWAFEEADRRSLVDSHALEAVYARGFGRRGLKPFRLVIEETRMPDSASPLEDRVLELCHDYGLPMPQTNVTVLDREVDAFWPEQRLMVEADSFEFHSHRAAFERDRSRDAAMQVAGYRVLRLTHRRLKQEPSKVAAELRHLLAKGRAAA